MRPQRLWKSALRSLVLGPEDSLLYKTIRKDAGGGFRQGKFLLERFEGLG